ncbi:MAG: VanW family protein [Microgenomates group bacterium]
MFKKKNFKIKSLKYLGIALGVVLLFIALISIPFFNKIYPNIYVSGVYLGDKTKEQAVEKLNDLILADNINLIINDTNKEISTNEIVKAINYQKSVERAYNFTNTGNVVLDLYSKIKLIVSPVNLSLIIDFDDEKIKETLLILSAAEGNKPTVPSVKIVNGQAIVDVGKNGIDVDIIENSNKIKNNLVFNKNEPIKISLVESKVSLTPEESQIFKSTAEKLINKNLELVFDFDKVMITDNELVSFLNPRSGFDTDKIKIKIADISRKINRNPQDSVFIVENGNVTEFTPSKDGVTVNENELINEIEKFLSKLITESDTSFTFNIPTVKSPAKIKNEDVNDLGIKTLLGKGVSHFAGSIPNRIHNVNLAQSKFKGILVPPDEIFSFNNVLGDVSSYTGYKAAYVIKDGKTVLGDGGGVCQVSTTLFRAILSAGLPIVERRPHSYRVGYYEQGFGPGLDATVYYPTTDLKFKNDTGAYLLIQPTIDNPNYTLTFEIYGTNDGRISTVSKPVITSSTAPAADLYVDDPTLKAGVVKQIEHRAYGARVVFDYKVERNGEVLIDQKFVSTYRPWQAVYLKGTATQ